MAKSKSSHRWLQEHHSDPYVQQARREGYRSRAVYKLMEIDNKEHIFKRGQSVIDLGAAPGSWSEYARQLIGDEGRLIAVDLLPMDPLAGVNMIQGDFTEQEVLDRIMELVGDKPVDLVISDMAPNMTGMGSVDQPKSMYLVELAFDLAKTVLDRDGVFVTKLFHGEGFDPLVNAFKQYFRQVKFRKPDASRGRSRETYAVARGVR